MIGHFCKNPSEGVRVITSSVYESLSQHGEVLKININSPFSYLKILSFKPRILQFVLSPTTLGLIACKVISFLYPKAKTCLWAPHPSVKKSALLRLPKPDLIITQSTESEAFFKELGFKTMLMPNGVDKHKFYPAGDTDKKALRLEYGLPLDKTIVLHSAAMRTNRNLSVFTALQKIKGVQAVLIGREGEGEEKELTEELVNAGCIVIKRYLNNIEELYRLSDYYIFPVKNPKGCIEMPLSVLEAMACGLTVISTPFGALPDFFSDGEGIFYAEAPEEMTTALKKLMRCEKGQAKPNVKVWSWNDISDMLVKTYKGLL